MAACTSPLNLRLIILAADQTSDFVSLKQCSRVTANYFKIAEAATILFIHMNNLTLTLSTLVILSSICILVATSSDVKK